MLQLGADLWKTQNWFLERKDPDPLPKSQRMPPGVSETATKRAIELKFQNDFNHYGPKQETKRRDLSSPIWYNKTFFEKVMMVVRSSGKALLHLWVEVSFEVDRKDRQRGWRLFLNYAFYGSKHALWYTDSPRYRSQSPLFGNIYVYYPEIKFTLNIIYTSNT